MIKIGRKRLDLDKDKTLKNTCPVCGYLTLDERDAFEICSICFWEDDGIDDNEEDFESGPNHMTLREARQKFQSAKEKILISKNDNSTKSKIRLNFLKLDELIVRNSPNTAEIKNTLNELITLSVNKKIYGIENLNE